MERASQLHRELAPIQVWLSYLLFGYERINGKMLGVVLVACYIISKGRRLLKGARHMHKAVCKLMQSTVSMFTTKLNDDCAITPPKGFATPTLCVPSYSDIRTISNC